MRPAVAVYNSPVLPSEPSSRRPVQPLRVRPSSPAEPVALRQPTPQPFRARPRSLAASEWKPCGLLAGDPLESFPSPTGFLTGRERSVGTGACSPQSGTSVQEQAFDPGKPDPPDGRSRLGRGVPSRKTRRACEGAHPSTRTERAQAAPHRSVDSVDLRLPSGGGCNKGHASATAKPHTVTNLVTVCDSKPIQGALPFALAVVGPVVRLDPPPIIHVAW
jgi:hypothetical protein